MNSHLPRMVTCIVQWDLYEQPPPQEVSHNDDSPGDTILLGTRYVGVSRSPAYSHNESSTGDDVLFATFVHMLWRKVTTCFVAQ